MNAQDRDRLLKQADDAMQIGEATKARQLFEQVLHDRSANDKQQHRAKSGIADINQWEQQKAQIQADLEAADQLMADGDYETARRKYSAAVIACGVYKVLTLSRQANDKLDKATDLAYWQKTATEIVAEAQTLLEEERHKQANEKVEKALQELKRTSYYAQFSPPLLVAQQAIWAKEEDSQLEMRLRNAYSRKDFEQVLAIHDQITHELNHQTEKMVGEAKRQWEAIARDKERIEDLIAEERWDDANSIINNLRKLGANPVWDDLLLLVGMNHGKELLAKGQEANTSSDFKQARSYFIEASNTFSTVRNEFSDHKESFNLQFVAQNLKSVAHHEQQAQVEWDGDRRRQALAALDQAEELITQMMANHHEHSVVTAVAAKVEGMRRTIQSELEQIKQEEAAFRKGENYKEAREWEKAKEQFEQAESGLLAEHSRQASAALREVEKQIALFKQWVAQSKEVAAEGESLKLLRQAADLWPQSGNDLLISALSSAAENAVKDKDEFRVATYCGEILALDPDNTQAKLLQGKLSVQAQVDATLQKIEQGLASLTKDFVTASATKYNDLLADLAKIRPTATVYPDLLTRIDSLKGDVETALKNWQGFDDHYKQAQASILKGEWATAVTHLQTALQHITPLPDSLHKQLDDWQKITQLIENTLQIGSETIQKVEDIYASIPKTGDYDGCLQALNTLLSDIEELARQAQQLGGILPPSLYKLNDEAKAIRLRTSKLREAVQNSDPFLAYNNIQNIQNTLGNDDTINAIANRLAQQRQQATGQRITTLLREAEFGAQDGDQIASLNKLREARDLDPDNQQVLEKYSQTNTIIKTKERVRRALDEQDLALDQNSKKDALEALRKGIYGFLHPNSGLSGEVRRILSDAQKLTKQILAAVQTIPPPNSEWLESEREKIKILFDPLQEMRHNDVVLNEALFLIEPWLTTEYELSELGFLDSARKAKDFLVAYRISSRRVNENPSEENQQAQASDLENLIKQICISAEKRIKRAEGAIENTRFVEALDTLNTLDEKFYGAVEKEFPNLLDDRPEIDKLAEKQASLKEKAGRLQEIYTDAQQRYEKADASFFAGNFEEALLQLDGLPDLIDIPTLDKNATALRQSIVKTQQRQLQHSLQKEIHNAEHSLSMAVASKDIEAAIKNFEVFPTTLDFSLLSNADQELYNKTLARMRQQREDLVAGDIYFSQGKDALDKGDYATAVKALQSALDRNRDGDKEPQIALLLQKASELLKAQTALDEGLYAEAYRLFQIASRQGFEVTNLLLAAEAGQALQHARSYYNKGETEDALLELDSLLEKAQEVIEAKKIVDDAARLKRKINRSREVAISTRENLEQAKIAIALGDLDQAQELVKTILKEDPDHAEAVRLQKDIGERRVVDGRLQDVAQEFKEHNFAVAHSLVQNILAEMPDQRDALAWDTKIRLAWAESELEKARDLPTSQSDKKRFILKSILDSIYPDYPAAKTLLTELEAQSKASAYLKMARTAAHSHEFKQAKTELDSAQQNEYDMEELLKTQQEVARLENAWGAAKEKELDSYLRRREEFKEALDLSRRWISQTSDDTVQRQLEKKQRELVSAWIEDELKKLQRELESAKDANLLTQMTRRLEQLQKLDPSPTLPERGQLDNLAQKIHIQRLEIQRQKVLKQKERQQWKPAEEQLQKLKAEADDLNLTDLSTIFQDDLADVHYERLALQMEKVRQLQKDQRWEEAIKQAQGINQEAHDLSKIYGYRLSTIAFEASTLEIEIEGDKESAAEKNKANALADLLNKVKAIYDKAVDRFGLEAVQEVFEESRNQKQGFDSEPEVLEWKQKISNELKYYDETERTLKNARDEIEDRNFASAEKQLRRVTTISHLLANEYNELLHIVGLLQQAQQAEKANATIAYQKYREALQEAPSLKQYLEQLAEQARQQAWQGVVTEVRHLVTAIVPNPERAEQLLNQAQEDKLCLPSDKSITELRSLLPGKRALVSAIHLLENDPPNDVEQAIGLLNEAGRSLPSAEMAQIEQWQLFAQAWKAYHAQAFKSADDALKDITSPISERPQVKQLHQKVIVALEDESLLLNFEGKIKQALHESPVDYERAVMLVHEAKDGLRDKSFVQELQKQVEKRLLNAVKTCRDNNDYAQAIIYSKLLLRLPPTDLATTELANGLEGERQKRLDAILGSTGQADEAWHNVDTYKLEKTLNEAKKIAHPEGDPRIAEWEDRSKELRQKITQVNDLLKQVQTAQQESAWENAITYIQRTNDTLPAYQPALEQKEVLRKRMLGEARTLLEAQSFVLAIDIGQLGATIQHEGEFTQLVEEAKNRREAIWERLRQQAKESLTAWNLDVAIEAIKQGLALAPKDDPDNVLSNYYQSYAAKKQQAPDIARLMDNGWQALRRRDYADAQRLFAEARNKAPDFAEAESWRQFSINMEKGVKSIGESKFKESVRTFADAESWLRVVEGEYLPSIISSESHLRQMRRQAVYDAYRLKEAAQKMMETKNEAEEAYKRNNLSQSWELINSYKQQQQQFESLHGTLTSPPADFDGMATSAKRPQATPLQTTVPDPFARSYHSKSPTVLVSEWDTSSPPTVTDDSYTESKNDGVISVQEPTAPIRGQSETIASAPTSEPPFGSTSTGWGSGWGGKIDASLSSDDGYQTPDVAVNHMDAPTNDETAQHGTIPASDSTIDETEPFRDIPDLPPLIETRQPSDDGLDEWDTSAMTSSWMNKLNDIDIPSYDEDEGK